MEIPPLNISVTKAAVNGQVVDVVDYKDYSIDPDAYAGRSDVGIPAVNTDGTELLLPARGDYNPNATLPGYYNAGSVDFVIYPDPALQERYIPRDFITMSNNDDIVTLIKRGEAVNKLDESFITTPDSVTHIPIKDTDQPEMKGLKMALNAKHIDLDKYAGRFKDNYPNDKRQLKNSNATLKIIKRFCENCDMEALLIFRDKNDHVLNPMNTEIVVSLTDGSGYYDDEDEEISTVMDEDLDESSDYSDD